MGLKALWEKLKKGFTEARKYHFDLNLLEVGKNLPWKIAWLREVGKEPVYCLVENYPDESVFSGIIFGLLPESRGGST